MIKNEKQLKVTESKLKEFENSIVALKSKNSTDLIDKIMISSMKSQIDSLKSEILEYKKLKSLKPNILISKIEDLPETLIKARILKGYTQKDLADLAGLKEQQIQRYEATNYDSINFGKLIYISKCMGLQFDETKAIIKEDLISVKGIDNDMLRQATIKLHSRKQLLTV